MKGSVMNNKSRSLYSHRSSRFCAFALALLVLLSPLALFAATYTDGSHTYTYTTSGSNATITGYNGPGGAVSIPAAINAIPSPSSTTTPSKVSPPSPPSPSPPVSYTLVMQPFTTVPHSPLSLSSATSTLSATALSATAPLSPLSSSLATARQQSSPTPSMELPSRSSFTIYPVPPGGVRLSLENRPN